MECYFDNAATTAVLPQVKEWMVKLLDEDFGNPSSQHAKGLKGADYVRKACQAVAKTLKCQEKEIVFTSGGTESNNLAIIGTALAHRRKGKHILTTGIEHASVLATVEFLEKEGFEIEYLAVDEHGIVKLDDLRQKMREDTILVSCMYVNNEMGAVEPIAQICDIIHEKNEQTIIHADAVQAYGKMEVVPKKLGVDLLSISSHKIHGPKGAGVLYVKEKTLLRPIIYGGGQQHFMRSGTENVPAIAGMGIAASYMYDSLQERMQGIAELKRYFIEQVTQIEGVYDNSGDAPHIASITFTGVRAAVLMRALSEKEIYVSAGSACSSNKPQVSHVLKQIGLDETRLESTLRFSFCETNTKEQIDYCMEVLRESLPLLRRYTRKK
ncbi:MAG: cysteine desulfurase family protein [Wujia sp.]